MISRRRSALLVLFFALFAISDLEAVEMRVYFGTYTQADSQGIYVAKFDSQSGQLSDLQLAGETKNPSFVAIHPNRKFLYAVGEVEDYAGESSGFVRAFSIDAADGTLKPLNTQSSKGGAPCHLVIAPDGRTLLVANYSGGSVTSIALRPNGHLGEVVSTHKHVGASVNAARQQAPHAHSVNLDQGGEFAFVADLGLDGIVKYRFDYATGKLEPVGDSNHVSLPPGSGPRHFAFSPTGRHAFVINELSSTLTSMRYNAAAGKLSIVQTLSTLPDDYSDASYTAEVVVHPSGRFVFGSNRGHDSIAVMRVDNDGQLERIDVVSTGGKTPRNFSLDPTGQFLLAANQGTDNVVVFRFDAGRGELKPTGHELAVPKPVCVRFTR